MMSTLIIFLLLNLCLSVNLIRSAEHDPKKFYKCCPKSMELNIVVNDEQVIMYECMPLSGSNRNQTNKYLYNNKYNLLFDSYKTIIDHDSGDGGDDGSGNSDENELFIDSQNFIPPCENPRNYKIAEFTHKHSEALVPVNNYCVDLLNNHIVLLFCDEYSNNAIKVTKINKCCPRNFFYDTVLNECIEMSEQQAGGELLKNYIKNLNHLLKNDMSLFNSGPPKCNGPSDYVVEYVTNKHDLRIDKNNLYINETLYDNNLVDNNYCVELVYDTRDLFETDTHYDWIVQVCHDKRICAKMPCVHKCCPFGQKMVKDSYDKPNYCAPHFKTLSPSFHAMDDLDLYNENYEPATKDVHVFATKSGTTCTKTKLYLPHFINHKDASLLHDSEILKNQEYCVDIVQIFGEMDTATFQCLPDDIIEEKYKIMAAGFTFSSFFLLLTIFVYCSLPKLCNLHGKTLLGNVISSFMAYTTLAYAQFQTNNLPSVCKYLAFVIYFSFLSSFSWLNVMCVDMYLKIRSVAPKPGTTLKSKEIRRFILYSIFAVGYPLIMTTSLILIDMYATFPTKFLPNIGISTCWFQLPNSYGNMIYFTTPIGLQTLVNIVLFVLTALYCNKVKNEIARRDDNKEKIEKRKRRFLKHKDKIKLNVKLFIVMGISWFLEITSTIFVDYEPIFFVTDLFNTLHGLFIFIIFVCKRNIFTQIKEKLGMKQRKVTKRDTTMTTMISATGSSTCIDPYSTKYDKLNRSESRSPDLRLSTNHLRP